MFRTLRIVCSGRKSIDLALYRQFTRVCVARQKFSSVLCAPRGSRPAVEPVAKEHTPAKPALNSIVTDHQHGPEEFNAADELFHNQNGIANLKVSELLKDVPRTKHVRKRTHRNDEREQRKPPAPVLKKTEIEKDTLKLLQHRYQDPCGSEDRYDKALKLRYTVLQSNDARYGDLKMLVSSRKRREREKMLVLEGRRLILDGCAAGLRLEAVVASDVKLLGELGLKSNPKDCPFFLVNRQTMMEWSSLMTSPGLIGVFAAPQNLAEVIARNSTAGGSKRLPVTVVCDNIREPNNLGSVIRSCAAVSAQEVILLKGCAHPWDLKCLRGGAGSHFRIPIHGPMELYQLPELTRAGSIFVIADNKSAGDGLAGGFRWEQYDRIDYGSADHVALFIGGETYGVGEDVRRFVNQLTKTSEEVGTERGRKFVAHIPLANGVESLNTASALSILLYEIRKSLQPLMQET
ncbi:rRNA methyltransferase 3, mitochondrial [Anopheles darlingi]|uniref:rRNA methyltransferase 3, mitochondrial n=1 Tax=Anopheles darlingi TaxID=43151 RepID=UPI002100139E|nr:rRNA methyltransferase 3, mitochondrial [Anopheles darlingi]